MKQALEPAQALKLFTQRVRQLHRLSTTRYATLTEHLDDFLQVGLDMFDMDYATIGRFVDDIYVVIAARSAGGLVLPEHTEFPVVGTLYRGVRKTRRTIALAGVPQEERSSHPAFGGPPVARWMSAPLEVGYDIAGTLNFASTTERQSIDATDVELFEMMAGNVAWAMERVRHRDESSAVLRALEEGEIRHRRLVETAPIGMMVHSEGIMRYANAALCDMVEAYSPDDLVGRKLLSLVHVDDRHKLIASKAAMKKPGDTSRITDLRLMRMDGQAVEVEATGILTEWDGREAIHVTVEDVTERRRIERLKDEFISAVSHELRTPLTAMKGAIGLLQAGAAGEQSTRALGLLQLALRNSERLELLVSDLLEIQHLESGEVTLMLEPLDLAPWLREAVEMDRMYADRCGVEFDIDEPLPELSVDADPERLGQVLSNLLSNAAKFSTPGSTVRITLEQHGGWARVSVQDTGCGISDEFRLRIFDRFTQEDAGTARRIGGTGLGLSISRKLVVMHRGRLDFTSEVGKGSTFFMDLPLSRSAD